MNFIEAVEFCPWFRLPNFLRERFVLPVPDWMIPRPIALDRVIFKESLEHCLIFSLSDEHIRSVFFSHLPQPILGSYVYSRRMREVFEWTVHALRGQIIFCMCQA